MLNFVPINAENIAATADFFQYKVSRSSDYTVGAIYMWREFYDTTFTIYENMLLYKVKFFNRTSFTYPVGNGSFDKAMSALKDYCQKNNLPLWLCTVPEEVLPILVNQ
jgi:hypothetical protein